MSAMKSLRYRGGDGGEVRSSGADRVPDLPEVFGGGHVDQETGRWGFAFLELGVRDGSIR